MIETPPVEVPPEPKPPITFDPDGNLTLLVGPTKQSFRVCSRTVSRSSPVFRKMLNGPWIESKPANAQDWIVELPEDDEEALALVLHIIHAQFDVIKPTLETSELFWVCVIVNKYDLVHALRPWARAWCEDLDTEYADDRLLWIGWVLGCGEFFIGTASEVLVAAETIPSNSSSEGKPVLVTERSNISNEHEYVSSIGILGTSDSRMGPRSHEVTESRDQWVPHPC